MTDQEILEAKHEAEIAKISYIDRNGGLPIIIAQFIAIILIIFIGIPLYWIAWIIIFIADMIKKFFSK